MDIGKRLKIARDAIGYTLDKAEKDSGIGASSLSDFENEKREPKFSHLSKLARIYKRPLDFFLSDEPVVEDVVLWRDPPASEEEQREARATFLQYCEQYHRLEMLTGETKRPKLPRSEITDRESFDFRDAEHLAREVRSWFSLGQYPLASLRRVLEEKCYLKMFYLDFDGSAASTVSEKFGSGVLLNRRNKQWRRSYDLAHELFHVLTWNIFRVGGESILTDTSKEEKLANAFASSLLMPEEAIRDRIESDLNSESKIPFERLDDIAREFDVSLLALIYRIVNIYSLEQKRTVQLVDLARKYLKVAGPRESRLPDTLPERYCDLAVRALRQGRLSLMQFKNYMGISYREAEKYMVEEGDFTDEEVAIPVA